MRKYSDFYATVPCPENSFFIGANTPRGFSGNLTSYFSEKDLTKLYVIKGGPGTGKSTLMKRAAEMGEKAGAKVTLLYCSSDPDSLDGIIIEKGKIKIALCDGTAPHTLDPSLPGCCGEIINCGDAWNSSALEAQRDTVAAISASKRVAFERAYAFISAAAKIRTTIDKSAESYTDTKKLTAATARIVKKLPRPKSDGKADLCITEAVSMNGGVRLATFDRAARRIGIAEHAFIKSRFLASLADALKKGGHSLLISLSPLGDISEIYLPETDTAFVSARESESYASTINMKRFANGKLAEVKAKERFHEKFFCDLMYAATDALSEARKYHFQLEDIYVSAMDFDKLNAIGDSLILKIEQGLK